MGFATDSRDKCETLITLIIERAWEQPRYASSYAKLCNYFTKIEEKDFKFHIEGLKEKDKKNPTNCFKHLLIERVQHSFDKKEKKEIDPADEYAREIYLKDVKKNILGNVKFIGELIKSKVIKKKTIKYCIKTLMLSFLSEHYQFVKTQEFHFSYYEYQFEALIEFLENLGEKYESIDEDAKEKEQKTENKYLEVEKILTDICQNLTEPPTDIKAMDSLKADDFFKIFIIIDKFILSKKKGRLSALLKNLEERRDNKWKKHHVEAEGPKKLKDIKADDDEPTNEQKGSKDLAKLDDQMVKLLKNIQEEGNNSWNK